jgi:hypothetical protein
LEWWEGGNWDGQAKKKEASLDADELILLKNAFMMGGDQDGGVWGTLLLNYNSNQVPTWLSKDFEVPEQPEAWEHTGKDPKVMYHVTVTN